MNIFHAEKNRHLWPSTAPVARREVDSSISSALIEHDAQNRSGKTIRDNTREISTGCAIVAAREPFPRLRCPGSVIPNRCCLHALCGGGIPTRSGEIASLEYPYREWNEGVVPKTAPTLPKTHLPGEGAIRLFESNQASLGLSARVSDIARPPAP